MVTRRSPDASNSSPKRRPATTPEARENQLVNMAYDLAEKQLRDGTASSQVVTHWLKLGSSRERLEQERLENENKLTQAKIELMAQGNRLEELMQAAVSAMSTYQGREVVGDDDPDYD